MMISKQGGEGCVMTAPSNPFTTSAPRAATGFVIQVPSVE